MEKAKYTSAQLELYTIARLGWNSCQQHLADFADFKARYTLTYITDRLDELTQAENLPDDQARGERAETLRIKLIEQARITLDLWQRLKRYIIDAFPESLHKPKLESAGQDHYLKASQNNWDSLNGLLISGNNFIANNAPDLSANDNMPLNFPLRFSTARTEFGVLHQQFLDAEEQAYIQTQTKINANNEVYAKLMNMFLDGQEIYKSDEAIRKQFTFSEILYLVSGAGTAGVKGYITDSNTAQPIADVTVTIIGKAKTYTSDNEGKYEILQLANGTYTIQYQKTGYETQTIQNHEIKTGTIGKLDIQLTPTPPTQ